jgi:hypothetical protein
MTVRHNCFCQFSKTHGDLRCYIKSSLAGTPVSSDIAFWDKSELTYHLLDREGFPEDLGRSEFLRQFRITPLACTGPQLPSPKPL